jgi:TolB protein
MKGIFDAILSPDGRTIAFSAGTADARDANDIWVMNEDGSEPKRLVAMKYLQHSPTWSPDGHWIYFLSTDGGEKQDIWRVSFDGKTREQVTVDGLYQFDIAAGPNDLIAFSSNRSGNYEIWVQNGKEPPRQVTHDPAFDGGPVWNEAGTGFIFESNRGGSVNLWYLSLEKTPPDPPRQLTHQEGGARGAAWWHPSSSR